MTNPSNVIADIHGRLARIEQLYERVENSPEIILSFHDLPESELKKPQRPGVFNIFYAHYFAIHQMVFSKEDVDDMKRVIKHRLAEGVDKETLYWIYYLLYIGEFRLKMLLQKQVHDRFNIVPLGETCLPRALPAKWGFKRPRALGERSYPYDLSVARLSSVRQLLETRFAEYLDDRFLYYDQEKESCFHRELKIWWNHEKGESWRENNFSKLKERYRRRVDNFYKVFQEEKTALFFMHVPYEASKLQMDVVNRIHAALKQEAQGKVAVLCLGTGHNKNSPSFVSLRSEGACFDDLFIGNVPVPYPEYEWWKREDYLQGTGVGLQFELRIVDVIAQTIRALEPSITDI